MNIKHIISLLLIISLVKGCKNIEKENYFKENLLVGKWELFEQINLNGPKEKLKIIWDLKFEEKNCFIIENELLFLTGNYSINGDTLSMVSSDSNKIDFELKYIIENLSKEELRIKRNNQVSIYRKK
jgi:hypothetical protein